MTIETPLCSAELRWRGEWVKPAWNTARNGRDRRAVTITVENQPGSGGDEIAARVAETLGVPCLDRLILVAAAAQAGVDVATMEAFEHAVPVWARVLETLGRGGVLQPAGMVPIPPEINFITSADCRTLVAGVLREIAARGGAVVVGHAGQVNLRDVPGVLKVLVHAPLDVRVATVMAEEGLGELTARKRVVCHDRDRAAFMRSAFGVDFLEAGLYDLCINTGHLSLDSGICLVLDAARSLRGGASPRAIDDWPRNA